MKLAGTTSKSLISGEKNIVFVIAESQKPAWVFFFLWSPFQIINTLLFVFQMFNVYYCLPALSLALTRAAQRHTTMRER